MDIAAINLNKKYMPANGVEIEAVHRIDFSIAGGETVAIVGPSGAGKSTLLHLVGLMDRPTSGKLLFDGDDTGKLTDAERAGLRRSKIGFLFQLHYLLSEFTVEENLLIPVWRERAKKRDEARALLKRLGLEHRRGHLPVELSGGEQQRAALARALLGQPEILLCDEPTGNLDRETGANVEELIFSECAQRKVTLIIVTHNPELAARAHRIIEVRDGTIVKEQKQ